MKMSELPEGSLIDIEGLGQYELSDKWRGKNGKLGDRLLKETVDKLHQMDQVTVISVPFGVVAQLVLMLQDEYGDVDSEGKDITFSSVFGDAVARYRNFLKSEEVTS